MKTMDNAFGLLIMDHDPHTRLLLEPIAATLGGRLWDAPDGDLGLSLLAREKIDIVLLALPRVKWDGLELLERIVHANPYVSVIVVSGAVTVETAVDIMKKGASELLTKPIDKERLDGAVRQALSGTGRMKADAGFLPDLDHDRFAAIADSLPYGLLVCNVDGRTVFVNSAFERMLGPDQRIPNGLAIERYIQDERLLRLVNAAARGSTAAQESLTLELCQNGSRVVSARVRPLAGRRGSPGGAIVTLMDVTDMKLIDRVQSEFVSKVSHELRSPLSTIYEQLALVLSDSGGGLPDSDQHLLSRAKEKTKGLIDLIGDLLDLSRIEAGAACEAPKVVQVCDLLEKIVDFLHTRAVVKHQRLDLTCVVHPLPVQSDPLALESIFGNLITNAINYTPDGGRIHVTAEREGAFVCVRVTDTGFGIEERHLQKIFERFYRIKSDQTRYITGTGLGLPIVKGLVESLGGGISVESTPGIGSTFRVRLPAAD